MAAAMAASGGLRSKLVALSRSVWRSEKAGQHRLLIGCGLLSVAIWNGTKKVPPGHVGLVETRNGDVGPYLYDDNMTFLYLPYFQRPVSFRVLPVKKKMVKCFLTKDGRHVEVVLQLRLQPKIAFVREIYLHFGRDYGKAFLEREAIIDVASVIKNYDYKQLVLQNEDDDDEDVDESSAGRKATKGQEESGGDSAGRGGEATSAMISTLSGRVRRDERRGFSHDKAKEQGQSGEAKSGRMESVRDAQELVDAVVDELVGRISDCCAFHRLRLSEASVVFRAPEGSVSIEG